MPEEEHDRNDSACNLPGAFPPVTASPALANPPGQEEAQGNQVHQEHFPSCHRLGRDGVVAHPRGGVEVDVKEQDDDGEEDGYEDGHPAKDVQERPHHCTQSTHHHQAGVDGKTMEEVFDELEDFPCCLVVWGSSCQRAHPVLIYVQMVPGENLKNILFLF